MFFSDLLKHDWNPNTEHWWHVTNGIVRLGARTSAARAIGVGSYTILLRNVGLKRARKGFLSRRTRVQIRGTMEEIRPPDSKPRWEI
jgi:hypothetical protein